MKELELGVQVARVSSENCMEYSGLLVADRDELLL